MALGDFFRKITSGLARSAAALGGALRGLLGRKVDQNFLNDLEKILLKADVGLPATERILEQVKAAYSNKEASGDLLEFVKAQLSGLLARQDNNLTLRPDELTVIMVVGVNGSGKTTSIAKLAHYFQAQGKKVLLGAGDTYRAAAIEQLERWAKSTGAEFVKGQHGSDPAAVAYNAVDAALARKVDVAIIDTAGRLHTQTHLMRELEKIHRVIGKRMPGAPHEVLQVLDSTNGQNAIMQAKMFSEAVHCTGIILAKLDGTARGGFVVQIRDTLNLPVKFVGVGEKADDLEVFDAQAFVDGLFTDPASKR